MHAERKNQSNELKYMILICCHKVFVILVRCENPIRICLFWRVWYEYEIRHHETNEQSGMNAKKRKSKKAHPFTSAVDSKLLCIGCEWCARQCMRLVLLNQSETRHTRPNEKLSCFLFVWCVALLLGFRARVSV